MKKIFLLFILIFISNISASCDEGQIDINTASAEELDEIVYIGPARAEQIIALRPFDSVDDLIRVSGIGEVYLNAIKAQGLACVSDIDEDKKEDEINISIKEISENDEQDEQGQSEQPKERETIKLNPQIIKTEENKEDVSKNYSLYGFVAFCILIGTLFIIKNRKYKNEFR